MCEIPKRCASALAVRMESIKVISLQCLSPGVGLLILKLQEVQSSAYFLKVKLLAPGPSAFTMSVMYQLPHYTSSV